MKQLIIYFPFLLFFACTTETDNISGTSIPLPFKEAGMNLLDSVTRQIEWGELTLQIKYKTLDKRRFVDEDSPFLFSVDAQGKTIDSLKLFEHKPYVGTDSHYSPWVEINKAGIITTTDTSIFYAYKPLAKKSAEKFVLQEMYRDTAIHISKFRINRRGKISRIK